VAARRSAAGWVPDSAAAAAGRARRPALVTWLCVGVITLAGVQAAGLLGSLQLPDLPYAVPRAYFILRSGLWATWGLTAALGAFLGRPWGRPLLRVGGPVLAVWHWADRLLLTQSEFGRLGTPLRAAATLAGVGALLWILGRPEARRYFEENRR